MSKLEKLIGQIERTDKLIRMQATGSPEQLASRLKISKASLFRLLELMRSFKAPIKYGVDIQSYYYEENVEFRFGFYDTMNKFNWTEVY